MPASPLRYDEWVQHVFDHPVTKPEWWWDVDEYRWNEEADSLLITEYLTKLFEGPEILLDRYTVAQIGQAFWFMSSSDCSNYLFAPREVPWPVGQRLIRAIVPLYERLFARICDPRVSHLDRSGGPERNRANLTCYMFWDIAPFCPGIENADHQSFDAECLDAMRRTLAIPHIACQEAALHGLGHWEYEYPEYVRSAIDGFLAAHQALPPELLTYAQNARRGYVN